MALAGWGGPFTLTYHISIWDSMVPNHLHAAWQVASMLRITPLGRGEAEEATESTVRGVKRQRPGSQRTLHEEWGAAVYRTPKEQHHLCHAFL